ncbi:MAG TPA: DUF4340 domain-containing protein [Oscillatoriaceae cyanobacterium M33_DOE_052]|uniref:DUF4340 domain-containing protein n=1 Tax=Planktothricoides sp. SpSt-374 TaxID=2282167 RepID=A0A7C3VR34_9CYAN|nr:DUF4340 domain-containing protein [Oscillatoriaceae cyanobacterium M33_DOE_052]
MKIKPSTIVLLLIASTIAGGLYYHEAKIVPQQKAAAEKKLQLFTFTAESIKSLLIKTPAHTIQLERTPKPAIPTASAAGLATWHLKIIEVAANSLPSSEPEETIPEPDPNEENNPENNEEINPENPEPTTSPAPAAANTPTAIPAMEPYVSFLLEQLVKGRAERIINASQERIQEYGLDKPNATIEITLSNKEMHKLILGKREFTGKLIYAQIDPPAPTTGAQPVFLVSENFENAINRPLDEWKQPPEAETTPQNK